MSKILTPILLISSCLVMGYVGFITGRTLSTINTPSVQQEDSLNVRQVQKEWFMIGWQKGFDRGYQAAVDSMEVSRESY